MAKKKYNIENPDAYYRAKDELSLKDFNENYIQYLNDKQELETKKRQIRFTHHYMYDDALVNKGHFLLACYDTLTYIQEDCAATVPFTPTTYCYDKFYLDGFSVEGFSAGQTLEANLDEEWQVWVNAWATANGMADKTDKYPAGGTLVDYNKMVYEFAVDQYKTLYGTEKVFKPVIPTPEYMDELQLQEQYTDQLWAQRQYELQHPEIAQYYRDVTGANIVKFYNPVSGQGNYFTQNFGLHYWYYLAYLDAHAYYIPQFWYISQISPNFPNHLVLISLFYPKVLDFFVIPRKLFVGFGKQVDYAEVNSLPGGILSIINNYYKGDLLSNRVGEFKFDGTPDYRHRDKYGIHQFQIYEDNVHFLSDYQSVQQLGLYGSILRGKLAFNNAIYNLALASAQEAYRLAIASAAPGGYNPDPIGPDGAQMYF